MKSFFVINALALASGAAARTFTVSQKIRRHILLFIFGAGLQCLPLHYLVCSRIYHYSPFLKSY